MFENNGAKIKRWAEILSGVLIAVYVISIIGAVFLSIAVTDDLRIGFLTGIFSAIIVAISEFIPVFLIPRLLYGFGELITNSYGNATDYETDDFFVPDEKVEERYNNAKENCVHISFLAKDGAPEVASYSINNFSKRTIKSGETISEYIYGQNYELEFRCGAQVIRKVYWATDNSSRGFICTKDGLKEMRSSSDRPRPTIESIYR